MAEERKPEAGKRNPFTASINRGRYLRFMHELHKKRMKNLFNKSGDRHPAQNTL